MRTGTRCTVLVKLPVAFFRRQHAELRAGRRRQAGDVPVKHLSRQYIGLDRGRQPRTDLGELVLLEVGVHPEAVRRHQRDQLGTDRGIRSGARTAVADHAVDRRAKFGKAEVRLRQITVGHGLGQCRPHFLFLGVDHLEPGLSRRQGARLVSCSSRLPIIGVGLLEALKRGILVGGKPATTLHVGPRAHHFGIG